MPRFLQQKAAFLYQSIGNAALCISIHHHSGIDGADIRCRKIVSRILVSNHYFIYIIHRINRDVLRFLSKRITEIRKCLECLIRTVWLNGIRENVAVNGNRSIIGNHETDVLQRCLLGA